MKRIAWGITGAGHFLVECADLLTGLGNVDVFLLGRELERAALAVRLGKKYIQEEPLHWGYLGGRDGESDRR